MSPLPDAIQLVQWLRRDDPSDTHGKGPLNRAVAGLLGLQRLWLHAHTLALRHPVSGEALRLEAPLAIEWNPWSHRVAETTDLTDLTQNTAKRP